MKKSISKKFLFFVFIYFILVILIYKYYGKDNSEYLKVTLTAVQNSGKVTFRGMLIDKKWFNPNDVIITNEGWIEDKNGIEYTAIGGKNLVLQIPVGESYSITFNTGPEQGVVQIEVAGKILENNLWAETDSELGRAYELSSSFMNLNEMDEYMLNCNAVIVMIIILVLMIVLICFMRKLSQNKSDKNRENAIELLRFVIIICVCIHHYCLYAPGGYLGVDFFFVLSGFLLMKHFKTNVNQDDLPIISAMKYTKSRYIRLFPFYIFAFTLAIILDICLNSSVSISCFIRDNIWELLMVEGFGFTENLIVGPGWFCSALLISGFFIYLFLSKAEKTYLYCIAPISFFLIFSWMSRNFGNLNRWLQYDTIICTGTLRGFAEMGLGCICYDICIYLKEKLGKEFALISFFIELCCTSYIFYVIFWHEVGSDDFICVIFMAILITSFFIGNSMFSKFLNNRYSNFLGKISLAIYLNHMILGKINWYLLLGNSWYVSVIIYLIVVVVFSSISTIFINCIINCKKVKV